MPRRALKSTCRREDLCSWGWSLAKYFATESMILLFGECKYLRKSSFYCFCQPIFILLYGIKGVVVVECLCPVFLFSLGVP